MDNGEIRWFDLDLPDMIAARKKAFPERERVTMIVGSILENDWCSEVRKEGISDKGRYIFLAEGLFMYFTLEEIGKFLTVLKENFPEGGILIAEQNSKLLCKHEKQHDTVRNTNAHFRSESRKDPFRQRIQLSGSGDMRGAADKASYG